MYSISLLEQRLEYRRAVPAHEGGHAGDVVEKAVAQLGVVLVVEEGDHVGQQHIVGPLPTEEHGQPGPAVLDQHLID